MTFHSFQESRDVLQGLLDDVESNVTVVNLIKLTSNSTSTVGVTEKTKLAGIMPSTLGTANLQKAAVQDALHVLLLAKLKLGTNVSSGIDLINMIRKV